MLGYLPTLLLAATLLRGQRPKTETPPGGVEGVAPTDARSAGGGSGHKQLIVALRSMSTYESKAEKNAAKRLRKARRL